MASPSLPLAPVFKFFFEPLFLAGVYDARGRPEAPSRPLTSFLPSFASSFESTDWCCSPFPGVVAKAAFEDVFAAPGR